jgi:glycerol-3-phosphate cytidylyltransferase-like family protein
MIADIMHPGLTNIINEGAKYGDVVIGLFTDKAIATHKRLPYLSYEQRKEVLMNIKGVSDIVPQDEWSYVPNLLKYKPDYIIHGDDWVQGPDKYIRDEVFKTMEKIGGEVIEIPYTQGITSSGLANELASLIFDSFIKRGIWYFENSNFCNSDYSFQEKNKAQFIFAKVFMKHFISDITDAELNRIINEYSIDFTSVPNQPAFASRFYNLNLNLIWFFDFSIHFLIFQIDLSYESKYHISCDTRLKTHFP